LSSQYVTVRDGTKLAVDLYRPKDRQGRVVQTPLPVLWMHTPYCRRPSIDIVRIGEVYPGNAAALIDYGYVVAIADFRGLYASFGKNEGYNRGEWMDAARMDAYDITEWLAKQPWSSGKVGMWGCSATGGSQIQAATTAPPSLKAVFPMSCEFDAYPFGVPGGMSPPSGPTRSPPNTTEAPLRNLLASAVDEDTFGLQLQRAIQSHAGSIDNLGSVPFRDSIAENAPVRWWEESSPHTYLKELNQSSTAFYLAANWDEAATKYGAFFTFNNLTRPAKLVIGPEEHCAWSAIQKSIGYERTVEDSTGFAITTEELRFFDYWLKDIDNGVMSEPQVYFYTYNAEPGREWTASRSWPLANEQRAAYYLGAGTLSTDAPTSDTAADAFVVDYAVSEDGPEAYGLRYETAALEQAVQVTGHPVVELWLASSATDSDVVAYLQDVAPDGTATSHSMHGRLRASLRKEEPAPYDNLGLPWHGFREADAEKLEPGEPVRLRFDILPFSMVFAAGHKIRLVLTFADRATPVLTPPPIVSVYRDRAHASSITLPIIPR
jgi:putative CocE/NonD family hydrolase